MCDNCQKVILQKEFYSPRDYKNCLDYIMSLLASGEFELIEATCDIDKIKSTEGWWADDIIEHVIQCKNCNQLFTCSCNTYHGKGFFRKGKW